MQIKRYLEAELTVQKVTRVRCEPEWRLAQSWSDRLSDFDMWFVWAGAGRMELADGESLDLLPGVCLWMRPGGRYLAEHDAGNPLGVTAVHFDLRRRGRLVSAPSQQWRRVREPGYPAAVLDRVVDLKRADRSGAAAALLRGFLHDYLDGFGDMERPTAGTALHHEQVIRRVAGVIAEQPNAGWTVAELARDAGYSESHFSRVFAKVMGVTPKAYIVAQRIERAKLMLTETSLTIGQVADRLGYQDFGFFSRQFKRVAGVSASGWRGGEID